MNLYCARIGFLIGGRPLPDATLLRAAKIFSTPFRSSRARAASAQTAGAREEWLTVDGIEIATYLWGNPTQQPYVLFAHGWSSHDTRIAPRIEPLQTAGYAVVAFDQAGHGKSGGHRTTLPDFACHLLAVGQRYGPAAAILGHSLGGAAVAVAVAVALALARGLAAERAILIAPAADPLAAMERFSRFVWLGVHFGRRLAMFYEHETRVPINDLQAHRNAPLIGRPALIVHDVEDREVPWSERERYARLWHGARMLSTCGFGHNRIVEHPQVIDDALRFLRSEPVGTRIVSSPNLPYGFA